MYTDKTTLSEMFLKLDGNLKNYSPPSWNDFPDIELYMDQVISLITKYLENYHRAIGAEKLITPSMINNYVKLKIIPPPEKKKYSRTHLAYLIMICTLKQTLDMATIQKIIPLTTDTERIKKIYASFVENGKQASSYASEHIKTLAAPVLESAADSNELNELLLRICSLANIYKTVTENITKSIENTNKPQ